VQDESHVERREVVHVDPGKISLCERLKQIHLDPRRPHLGSAAIETKEPFLLSEVSTDYLRTIAQSDEHLRVLQELDPKSLMAVPLLAHGRLLGALVFISSHSSRRYRESELQLAQELAHRAALVIDNARLHEAAQRAIQARDEVLGVVAHDLRNPLGSILMQAALLRPRDGETERRSRIPAERIERAATRMNRLIQDLIDVTRMEGGRLSIEQVRVPAERVVSDSAEAQKLLASSASLEIQLDVTTDLPDIWADRDRLLQVFENLISNAVKFTKAGGRITVGAAPREGEVLFWVADTGVGIGGGDLPHLFDRFWQARKAGRQGAGLGLPIVKGIIEAHGGRIWVESQVGVGSTFFFTLPLARSERGTAEVPGVTCTENHAATRKQPAAESRQPARVVLVAEDDLDVREALCGTLERAGYKVATAANGAEALEYLHREAAPFLVILDLKMPVMDGWAFLTERNRDPDLRSIPVIVVSGERDIKDRVAAAHGSYIQKPILPKRLFETMEHVLP
jgi:signal transduction histidine kinase